MSLYFVKINNKDVYLVDKASMEAISKSVPEWEDLNFTKKDPKDLTKVGSIMWVRASYYNTVEIIEADG